MSQRVSGLRTLLALLLLGLVALNAVAYQHAHAMLHFVPSGEKTNPPERLSLLEKLRVVAMGITVPRPLAGQPPSDLAGILTEEQIAVDDRIHLGAWWIPSPKRRGTVIAVHGYSGGKSQLLEEAREFLRLGWSVLLVDRRGSGGSSEAYTTIGYREADDVLAALRFVVDRERTSGPIVLYGRSMGAAAIMRAVSIDGSRINGVILEGVFGRLSETVARRFELMGLPAHPLSDLLVFWGGFQFDFSGFAHNPVDYARSVRVPTLMLHGRADPRATLAQAVAVYEALSGPKHLETFERIGHQSILKQNARGWRKQVGAFLTTTLVRQ
ncbi:MAG: alpha/beta fold hydrolase [Myxococcales bacterium]|nr:alpha/beta fold hydrolase [Myxococcales bacterium]